MFRLIFLTFFGTPRYDEHHVHVHESPKNMTIPLMILAFFSIFGGWFAAPHVMGGTDYFSKFLAPVFSTYAPQPMSQQSTSLAGNLGAEGAQASNPALELVHALVSWPVGVAILGLLLAWWMYIKKPDAPKRLAQSMHGLYMLVFDKYYVDEIYAALIVRPLLWISTNVLWHGVDVGVIDGIVNGSARVARASGGRLRELQSGNTRSYASWVLIGVLGFTVLLLALYVRGAH
jgi:NADH-quinone oxidoreductase subunit L